MSICPNCQKEFIKTPFHPKQRHCNSDCCRKAYRKKNRDKLLAYHAKYYQKMKEMK